MKKNKSRYLKAATPFALIFVSLIIFLIAILMHTPKALKQWQPERTNKISDYLTHILAAQFFIDLQKDKPFEVKLSDDNINEILSHKKWGQNKNGFIVEQPLVLLVNNMITAMTEVDYKGMSFALTVSIEPVIDEKGLLGLDIVKVRIGALGVTPIAKKICAEQYEKRRTETAKPLWQSKLEKALLTSERVEPVFEILPVLSSIFDTETKTLRITDIKIADREITIKFSPLVI